MGLIEYLTKNERNESWCGWVDAATKQPVKDSQIKERYEATILAHTGMLFSLFNLFLFFPFLSFFLSFSF
jgi:3-oxoacyl-ACP reductase-like protein